MNQCRYKKLKSIQSNILNFYFLNVDYKIDMIDEQYIHLNRIKLSNNYITCIIKYTYWKI